MTAQLATGSGDPGAAVARRLVIADLAYQYPVAPVDGMPVLVAELAAEAGDEPRAMEFLRPEQTVTQKVSAIDARGVQRSLAPPAEPLTTWADTDISKDFTGYLRTAFPAEAEVPDYTNPPLSALTPLMLLRTHATAAQPYTEVLMCARLRTIGVLFVRVARFSHSADASLSKLVTEAMEHRFELQDYVRFESNAFLPYEKGVEIEQKVTLRHEASIWSLSKGMWTAVENGDFPGFITDPGYELTRWHFVQHNFEVLGPAEEVGHYAFQENPDGSYALKMKKFSADALRREETFREGVRVPGGDFEAYLAMEFPALRFRRLPSFQRTRFDVNVESVTTGHCFGIETDEVTVEAAGGRKLRQVEMEYLQTRRHEGMDASSIEDDLDRLTSLVEAYLARIGVAAERNLYSKLSFLRDCTSAPVPVDS